MSRNTDKTIGRMAKASRKETTYPETFEGGVMAGRRLANSALNGNLPMEITAPENGMREWLRGFASGISSVVLEEK